ncbi:uncharacterized protein LOC125227521 [Leguminivora glycinivorella]|uniref:uncharacterized protein LOC125227521 n=1 Tax=Leguminivora glycinivorella TaxID=1035111 RepID=UPI00201014AE|nr:uncharacterized protein LOC125227521 [Leguminivora glycinivorella]
MHARALFVTIFVAISNCVTLTIHQNNEPDIVTHSKEELPPLFIVCNLTDIVTITAPDKYSKDALYYLYNPTNDVTKLDIKQNVATDERHAITGDRTLVNKYSVRNVNLGKKVDSKTNDSFGGNNEFDIGPVGEEDHGNWVLSIYYKRNGSWVEVFQVITIQIVDYVPIEPSSSVLNEGETLELRFAYPLPDVETCELVQPAVDRPYDREYERTSLHTCTYVLRNLSAQDSGVWKIVAVGNIVYEGRSSIEVKKIRENILEALPLVSSSGGTKYLMCSLILPVGLILKIYCL